jgi:hypothetical protein
VARLGWTGRVRVVAGDIARLGTEPAHQHSYDVVTARSFGPPEATLTGALAFVRPGGTVLISDPPEGGRWPDVVRELGTSVRWCGSTDGISVFVATD